MKKDIVHPNIQKIELHIRETVLGDEKIEEIEKVISFPNTETNNESKFEKNVISKSELLI